MAIKGVLTVFVLAMATWLTFWSLDRSPPKDNAQTASLLPVVYDVANWQAPAKTFKPFADEALLNILGGVATQESALDFGGNEANYYRYHHRTAPPLYVVQSDEFFEIAWYFATSHDKDSDKVLSQRYAQTAYALSHQALGDKADTLFVALLAQQFTALPAGVVYAKCQAQLCRIVFDKWAF